MERWGRSYFLVLSSFGKGGKTFPARASWHDKKKKNIYFFFTITDQQKKKKVGASFLLTRYSSCRRIVDFLSGPSFYQHAQTFSREDVQLGFFQDSSFGFCTVASFSTNFRMPFSCSRQVYFHWVYLASFYFL